MSGLSFYSLKHYVGHIAMGSFHWQSTANFSTSGQCNYTQDLRGGGNCVTQLPC